MSRAQYPCTCPWRSVRGMLDERTECEKPIEGGMLDGSIISYQSSLLTDILQRDQINDTHLGPFSQLCLGASHTYLVALAPRLGLVAISTSVCSCEHSTLSPSMPSSIAERSQCGFRGFGHRPGGVDGPSLTNRVRDRRRCGAAE